jgi:hypothetical protein
MASFGKTARQAFTTCGGIASAGKILIPSAPAFRAAKASVGVATPGVQTRRRADETAFLGAADHVEVGVGHHNQLAADIANPVDLSRIQYRAGADEHVARQSLGQDLDASERFRRVERHLDQAEACLDESHSDRLRILGPEASQNGDEGQFREVVA